MLILAIESSCDETAASVVTDDRSVLSSVVHSQARMHSKYGGVVPELASRDHVVRIVPVVEAALDEAGVSSSEIDVVAATYGPGLVGSLLVGLQMGKALAYAWNKPFVAVNHLEAHLAAAWLADPDLEPPFIGLVVSGGHTSLLRVRALGSYELLGATRDDAAGEAFDKVGKMLGLTYPAGPEIERVGRAGDPNAVKLPRPMMHQPNLDFSFSGLKTAVLTHVEKHGHPRDDAALADLCASVQEAIVDVLWSKTRRAMRQSESAVLAVVGGVAANGRLRHKFQQACEAEGWKLVVPQIGYCTDNAAMVGSAAVDLVRRGSFAGFDFNARANLRFGE